MNKRIFNFPDKIANTDYNNIWVKIKEMLDREINSLQYYLDFFNPDFYSYNNIIEGSKIREPKEYRYKLEVEGKNKGYLYIAPVLSYREGFYNQDTEGYIIFENVTPENGVISFGKKADFNNKIEKGKIKYFPAGFSLFSVYRPTKGIDDENNPERLDPNTYILLSTNAAAYYNILTNTKDNKDSSMNFNFLDSKKYNLGTQVYFNLEFFPDRYILKDKSAWGTAYKKIYVAANWPEINTMKPNICNIKNVVWNGSFPLMHELYVNNTDELITDDSFSIAQTNVANHNIFSYNITINGVDNFKDIPWDNVYINLI